MVGWLLLVNKLYSPMGKTLFAVHWFCFVYYFRWTTHMCHRIDIKLITRIWCRFPRQIIISTICIYSWTDDDDDRFATQIVTEPTWTNSRPTLKISDDVMWRWAGSDTYSTRPGQAIHHQPQFTLHGMTGQFSRRSEWVGITVSHLWNKPS